jgi:hypothetical protein
VQQFFFDKIAESLSTERLEVYGQQDNPGPCIVLARYLLNMALCESLYSPLQFCEIALRNSVHRSLTNLYGREDWYDAPEFELKEWAVGEIEKAKGKIRYTGKSLTSGRVIAELQFGFWTSLFEPHYEQRTRFLPKGIKEVFPYLPKSEHSRKDQKRTLESIRQLRNRVFHHERIVHWADLPERHTEILRVISWISKELHETAVTLDRFTIIRSEGLDPWIAKIRHHWPREEC